MIQYGEFLKSARKVAGLSQEALAEKLYLPRSTISKVENNKMELRFSDVMRWFQATNAPEVLAAALCGVDIAALAQTLSMLVGGFIKLL